MDFKERKQKALAIMASRKMWKSNYAPPLIRLLYFMVWRPQGMSPLFACAVSLIAGVLFGLTMALFHLWRRSANKLPDWKDL